MFRQATDTIGAPTIVVNNAGVSWPASAVRLSPADWDRMIAVNLSGAFYCTQAALPAMYDRGWGRLIYFGSPGGGRTISAGMAAYAAAKAGLVAMARAIAMETARRGITVNTVVPGYVETDMVRSSGAEIVAQMDASWPKIPAEAVAELVGFLVSPAAEHISGEDIAVWRGGPSPIIEPPPRPAAAAMPTA
jgi:3-oxoacyl-[acyl-carrier protein] reductase